MNFEGQGFTYTPQKTSFKVYAPEHEELFLNLYHDRTGESYDRIPMHRDEDGFWYAECEGDLEGVYYTYATKDFETTDPYSVLTSMNGTRSAVVNLEKTDPRGFRTHRRPGDLTKNPIIMELHIKDYTYHPTSGVQYRGKYLGLAERGTHYKNMPTALDHLVELGVTHVQILPMCDFVTVDEDPKRFDDDENYNWGYDPDHYNVPEGSYALDAGDFFSRITELKSMIMAIHEAGLGVIMDVVYNHTYRSEDSNFHLLAPFVYHRREGNGFSNGSGCGNEFATETEAGRAFLLHSLKFWVEEYAVDGFRFDLMGLMDAEALIQAKEELLKDHPDLLFYGEPWAGGASVYPQERRMLKGRQKDTGIGVFTDEFRDAVRGDNDGNVRGFIQGDFSKKHAVETGIAGSIAFDDNHIGVASMADESINYINCHDNLILRDKLEITVDDDKERIERYELGFAILLTSFGRSFLYEGNEFYHTKKWNPNTYNAPTSLNAIDWSRAYGFRKMTERFKTLIAIRKAHPVFGITDAEEIRKRLTFLPHYTDGLILYRIEEDDGGLVIFHHADTEEVEWDEEAFHALFQEDAKEIRVIYGRGEARNDAVTELKLAGIDTAIIEYKKEETHGLS